jgi:hypothetical protein
LERAVTQVAILNGIYSDMRADFRSSYPRNLVPVPKDTGISKGYLRSAPGVSQYSYTITSSVDDFVVTGQDRGAIVWDGLMYRVIGDALCRVNADATLNIVGRLPGDEQVSLDYSFDRLGIAAGGGLYYFDGSALTKVTDPDLGTVNDMVWLGGYFLCTDGASIVSTDLTDPTSVNPLKYGSSEVDPDPIVALRKLRNELYGFNRYTTQVYQNVGGTGFPFAQIPGALIERGVIGRKAVTEYMGAFAFIGSGRNEQPSVYMAGNGTTQKIATREIEILLAEFTEAELAQVICERREHNAHAHLYLHLPTITAVYDGAASAQVGEPVWFYLSSPAPLSAGDDVPYLFRNFVFAFDRWFCGSADPTLPYIYSLDEDTTEQVGTIPHWQFDTSLIYNEGRGFIIHNLELVPLTGRVASSEFYNQRDWKASLQYTLDGLTWSQPRWVSIGKTGDYLKRIVWRHLGAARGKNWIGLRFSGKQSMPLAFARLEAEFEALNG